MISTRENNIMAALLRNAYEYGRLYNEYATGDGRTIEDLNRVNTRYSCRVYGLVDMTADLLGKKSVEEYNELNRMAFNIYNSAADGKIK